MKLCQQLCNMFRGEASVIGRFPGDYDSEIARTPPRVVAERTARRIACANHFGGVCADQRWVSRNFAGGQGEDRIAIKHGMRRIHCARDAIMSHLRNFFHVRFAHPSIGRNNADNGVFTGGIVGRPR